MIPHVALLGGVFFVAGGHACHSESMRALHYRLIANMTEPSASVTQVAQRDDAKRSAAAVYPLRHDRPTLLVVYAVHSASGPPKPASGKLTRLPVAE